MGVGLGQGAVGSRNLGARGLLDGAKFLLRLGGPAGSQPPQPLSALGREGKATEAKRPGLSELKDGHWQELQPAELE